MHTVRAPGPGNNPSLPEHRQGASDGRRAERASEDTNETKNNVMEMAAYIAMHSRYSSTVCIHVVYHDGDSECKCVTARRRRRKIETERYFFYLKVDTTRARDLLASQ